MRSARIAATLNPCKLCASAARGHVRQPEWSIDSGRVYIDCTLCSNSVTVTPDDVAASVTAWPQEPGTNVIERRLQAAENEAVRRWNILNSQEAA